MATISANGDKHIGGILAGIFDKLGANGTITVQDGKTMETEVEYVEGIKWDRGYVSPYFVTDTKSQKAEFKNPLILLSDKKISNVQSILKFLEYASQNKRQLIIVAEDIDGEALATLVLNKLRGGLQICAVKSPGFGDNRRNTMQDIAIASGATFISEDIGLSLDEAELDVLGTCEKIIISKDDTIIMGGAGEKAEVEERVSTIAAAIETTTSEYDREKLKVRVGRLTGGVAVIKVGGASEVEVGELKDRIEDALCATRAAHDEGIVPGGGTALLYASKKLEKLEGANFDQNIGIKIVKDACKIPCKTICMNSGEEGSIIVQKLLEADVHSHGFDASVGEYCDLLKRGIIDPTKVVRTAITDACGVASLMITTEAMIVEAKTEGGAAGGPPGGMGGMGGY